MVDWGLLIIVMPIAVGAYGLLFSRRASLMHFRFQRDLFGRPYTEREVRIGQIFWVVIGAVLVIGGVLAAAQELRS